MHPAASHLAWLPRPFVWREECKILQHAAGVMEAVEALPRLLAAANSSALPATLFDKVISSVCQESGHVHCAVDTLALAPITALFLLASPFLIVDTLSDTPTSRRKGYVGSRAASNAVPVIIRVVVSCILALMPLTVVSACRRPSSHASAPANSAAASATSLPPRLAQFCKTLASSHTKLYLSVHTSGHSLPLQLGV